jgi:hypothetical protein
MAEFDWGGLVPLWILGAPLILAVFMLMGSPRPTSRRHASSTPGPHAVQGTEWQTGNLPPPPLPLASTTR